MFEQYKQVMTNHYNSEIAKFDELKAKLDDYERIMREDTSEEDYKLTLQSLNKEYGLFKRGKEYKEKVEQAKSAFTQKLKEYEKTYNEYVEVKNEAARISIYNIQKKLEQLTNATSLEDLKLTEEDAQKAIDELTMEKL